MSYELDNTGFFEALKDLKALKAEVHTGEWRHCYCGRVTKQTSRGSCSVCRRANYVCKRATLEEVQELGVTRKDLGRYDGEWEPWMTDLCLLGVLGLLYFIKTLTWFAGDG